MVSHQGRQKNAEHGYVRPAPLGAGCDYTGGDMHFMKSCRHRPVVALAVALAAIAFASCAKSKETASSAESAKSAAESKDPAKATEPAMPAAHRDAVHKSEHKHGAGHFEHRFERAEEWVARFDDPERDSWQKPAGVIAALAVEPGMSVADIGAGTGYFLPHLSRAVGADGQVFGLDVEPDMVRHMSERAEREKLANVKARVVKPGEPEIADGSLDRILIVNTWHHIGDRSAYARKLAAALKPGGSIAIIDYTKEAPHGPPVKHRLPAEAVVAELGVGGVRAEVLAEDLPHQYIVLGRAPIQFRNVRVFDNLHLGGQPNADELRGAAKAGVKAVISLRPDDEKGVAEERKLVAELGVEYISIPVAGGPGLTLEAAKELDSALTRLGEQPVIVHCSSGNRVGALFAVRAREIQKKSAEEAFAIGQSYGMTRLTNAVRERFGLGDARPAASK